MAAAKRTIKVSTKAIKSYVGFKFTFSAYIRCTDVLAQKGNKTTMKC